MLGVDIGPAALDETPLRLTRPQLLTKLPGLATTSLRRARAVGLIHQDGARHFIVRSPALLALVADGINAGVRLNEMLDMVGALHDQLGALAETLADQVIDRIWQPLVDNDRAREIEPLLQRGRMLLLQGALSTLADRLGEALLRRADQSPDRDQLRAAIDHVRVGVIVDTTGKLELRSHP